MPSAAEPGAAPKTQAPTPTFEAGVATRGTQRPGNLMRAAVIAAPGRVEIVELEIPRPGPGEARVRLAGCGVCGSNLPVFLGRPWFSYPLEPGAPGHEGWGWIDEVGHGVTGWREGDPVAALSYRAFAEFDVAPVGNLVRLPESLVGRPFPGEALGCAMNVLRRSGIEAGQTVAVVGVGFLGAVLAGLAAGAGARVIAVGRRPCSLDAAREMGAAELVELSGSTEETAERIGKLTEGRGCDRVIEAAGEQATLDLAGEITRERGRLIIAGYHQDGPRRVNMQSWNWRGLDVINAHEREASVYIQGMAEAVDAVTHGKLDPMPLFTHWFKLEELGAAFETALARPDGFMKAWVTP